MGLSFQDLLIQRENDGFLTNAFFFYHQEWKVYLLFFALFVLPHLQRPLVNAKMKIR